MTNLKPVNAFNTANIQLLDSNTPHLLSQSLIRGQQSAMVTLCVVASNILIHGENFLTEKQFYAIHHGVDIAVVEAMENFKGQQGYEAAKKQRQRIVNPIKKSLDYWIEQVDFSQIDFTDYQSVVSSASTSLPWINQCKTLPQMADYLVGFMPESEGKKEGAKGKDKNNVDGSHDANSDAGEEVLKAVAEATSALANKIEILSESMRIDVLGKRPTKKQIEAFDKLIAMANDLINQASL